MATSDKTSVAALLYESAEQMGLMPAWIQRGRLFAISVSGQEKYLYLSHTPLNPHVGASLAADKYATRQIMERHGLLNIPFAKVETQAEAAAFLQTYGEIIAKPHKGAGTRDIHIVSNPRQLLQLNIEDYILEQYVPGKEMRYLILNGKVIAVHQSDYGTSVQADRKLLRISYPKHAWDPGLTRTSVRIARVLGLKFAAVDFMIDANNRPYILEVNSRPGFKWFHAPSSGPKVDVARLFMEAFLKSEGIRIAHPERIRLGAPAVIGYN